MLMKIALKPLYVLKVFSLNDSTQRILYQMIVRSLAFGEKRHCSPVYYRLLVTQNTCF